MEWFVQDWCDGWNRHTWMWRHGTPAEDGEYVVEAVLDPDGVKDKGVRFFARSWRGWDCEEGEQLLADADGAVVRVIHNWWRRAWGDRHPRDLYRVAAVLRGSEIRDLLGSIDPSVALQIAQRLDVETLRDVVEYDHDLRGLLGHLVPEEKDEEEE